MRSRKEAVIRSVLLENYQSYYRLAFSYVHQEADAMDIVQEGAYKAMAKAASLRDESYAATWVYRIMINTAKDYLKKYERERGILEEDIAVSGDIGRDVEV